MKLRSDSFIDDITAKTSALTIHHYFEKSQWKVCRELKKLLYTTRMCGARRFCTELFYVYTGFESMMHLIANMMPDFHKIHFTSVGYIYIWCRQGWFFSKRDFQSPSSRRLPHPYKKKVGAGSVCSNKIMQAAPFLLSYQTVHDSDWVWRSFKLTNKFRDTWR